MGEIKTRLEDTSQACIDAFVAWDADKSAQTRGDLQEAIHELRKVSARLEIEITKSERGAGGKNLPIPTHRSQNKSKGPVESILPDEGNTEEKSPAKKEGARRARTRRPMPKKT